MTTTTKAVIALVVALIGVAIYGAYQYPKAMISVGAPSPAGSTFGDAKFAGVSINLANVGANGTSTSILNTDAVDRYVTSVHVGCQVFGSSFVANSGAGLANLQLTVGTSSTAAPVRVTGFSQLVSAANISTTSYNGYFATSTMGVAQGMTASSSLSAIWHSGEFMTFFWNATNTALCSEGVSYIPS